MLTISYATQADLPSWMKLVRLLRWNFPGLETEEALSDMKNAAQEYWIAAAQSVQRITSNCRICFFAHHNVASCIAIHPRLQAAGNCLKADWQKCFQS